MRKRMSEGSVPAARHAPQHGPKTMSMTPGSSGHMKGANGMTPGAPGRTMSMEPKRGGSAGPKVVKRPAHD